MHIRWLISVVALLLVASCSAEAEPAQVEVDVRATVCIDSGQRCFSLPVPEAEVTVARSDGSPILARGNTGEVGRLTLTISGAGPIYVTATSPVLAGGKLEHHGFVSEGGVFSVTFNKSMSTDIVIPAE